MEEERNAKQFIKLHTLSSNGWGTTDSGKAETIARQFIKQRHHKVERIFFKMMYREENSWVLHGEVQFKRAYFLATNKSFELKVNTDTGEVAFYEENPLCQLKASEAMPLATM